MELPQVTPGQGWLTTINNNFSVASQEFSKKSSRIDVVFLNGWQKDSNPEVQNEVIRTPMADGRFSYELKISAGKEVAPNESNALLMVPKDYIGVNYLGNVPTEYGGHAGGYFHLFFVGNKIFYHFIPNNGGVDGEANNKHQVWIQTTITWIV